tara:strand:+ start:147 stop:749 length:603 start_codon:yes stop_codon:yes gene_type:complete
MATHDYIIANASGAAVRSDLNNALAAIVSQNSSSSEPSTTYAYQLWADTTNNVLKIRNSANNAWNAFAALNDTAFRISSTGQVGIGVTPASNTDLDVTGTIAQNVVAMGALDVDCSAGNYFTKTINANSTFTFSNVPSSRAYSFVLELTHTSGTVTWPSSVKFPADTAPTLTTGKTHLFVFETNDGGTRFRGAALVDYVD